MDAPCAPSRWKVWKRITKELNAVAVGISVDSTFCKKAWDDLLGVKKTGSLSDFWPHWGELAKKLGIFGEKDGFSERANMLLDEDGKVIFVKKYPISQVPNLEEILNLLEKVKTLPQ